MSKKNKQNKKNDIGQIKKREIVEEMKQSYLDYAMSVIVSRALPDARDGLKPVHRRILYAMHKMGLHHKAKFRKSATVVGEVLGKYHPHGDLALYDAMARMAQDFSLRYPLIRGQGNWGSIDGDSPAAHRYTECKLEKNAEPMLADIGKKTVDFTDNYDGTQKEPVVLPAKLPQLLLNGVMGIAVGMASNIPPHNLNELIDAVVYLVDHPKASVEDLMQFIQGPDFPTGAVIYNQKNLVEAYKTGKGSVVIRSKANIDKDKIIISEIPYQVNKSELVKKIANLIRDKKIKNIKQIRDESDRKGIRILIQVKKGAIAEKVLNKLYSLTNLQTKFHFNMVALRDGIQPQLLSLKELLQIFIKHRREVVVRRAKYELKIAQARLHILEGLKKALDHIDEIIKTIKQSKDKKDAFSNLIKKFKFSHKQAQAILEMRLEALAGLERKKIEDELKEKQKLIKQLKALLASEKKINNLIKQELIEVKEKYGDERRTKVYKTAVKEFSEEDLVPNEETVITLSQSGYIKRVNPKIYKVQKRGGKGIVGMKTKGSDFVENFLSVMTHDDLCFFTNQGRVFKIRGFDVPEGSRIARGSNIVNLLQLRDSEKVTALMALPEAEYIVMATKKGRIKRTTLKEFANIRLTGLIAIKIKKDDELCWVEASTGDDQIVLITQKGKAIRFKEKEVRSMGRSAAGVKGMSLNKDDQVVHMELISQEDISNVNLLTLSVQGYGKQTPLKKYRVQKRGGKGVLTMRLTKKTGLLKAGALINKEKDEDLVVVSQQGQVIRLKAKEVSQMGRSTQGVRVMRLKKQDQVASMAKV